jgi:hypothetical protein
MVFHPRSTEAARLLVVLLSVAVAPKSAGLPFFECRLSARLRRADVPCECPLIGVDRKRLTGRQNDANDPDRTLAHMVCLRKTWLSFAKYVLFGVSGCSIPLV